MDTARQHGRRRGRWLLVVAALLVVLGAGHAMLLRWMGGRLEDGFAAWATARRAQGWLVEHGPPERGGWPLEATLRLPNFRFSGGTATIPGGVDWRATALVLRVVPPRLDELRVDGRGPQRLRLGSAEIAFAADRLGARLPLRADVLPGGGTLSAERLRIGPASAAPGTAPDDMASGGLEIGTLSLGLDTRTTATEGEAAVSLTAEASGLMLPGSHALGSRVERLGLDAVLTGPLPPGRRPVARAEAWRDAGGVLELRALSLRWGAVDATAAATLALDEALQPMGAGTLRMAGAEAGLDALAAAGVVPARAAGAAARIAGLLARPDPEGGPPRIEVPLTLEDRSLSLARIPVTRFAPLDWLPARTAPP